MPADGRDERKDFEAMMRRVYGLSRANQLRVFAALREYLAEDVGKETPEDRQVVRRQEALEAIGKVMADLGRAEVEPVTTDEFNDGARAIGSDWTSSRVIRAWGSWRQAIDAYRGQWVRETAAQRALRRATSGHQRGSDDYAGGLRAWLATRPASVTRKDYDAWVPEGNRGRPGDEPPYVRGDAIVASSQMNWADWLAVARGETAYAERSAQCLAERRAEIAGQELVSARDVGLLLDRHRNDVTVLGARPGFPRPVARVGTARVWYRRDIEAYREGRRAPDRQEGELQAQLMSVQEVAQRLGLGSNTVRTHLSERRHHLAPPPDGRVGDNNFWYRERVEAWLAQYPARRPDRIGRWRS